MVRKWASRFDTEYKRAFEDMQNDLHRAANIARSVLFKYNCFSLKRRIPELKWVESTEKNQRKFTRFVYDDEGQLIVIHKQIESVQCSVAGFNHVYHQKSNSSETLFPLWMLPPSSDRDIAKKVREAAKKAIVSDCEVKIKSNLEERSRDETMIEHYRSKIDARKDREIELRARRKWAKSNLPRDY